MQWLKYNTDLILALATCLILVSGKALFFMDAQKLRLMQNHFGLGLHHHWDSKKGVWWIVQRCFELPPQFPHLYKWEAGPAGPFSPAVAAEVWGLGFLKQRLVLLPELWSRDHSCSPSESWRRNGCSQCLELIYVFNFQRHAFILGLLSLLLLNSGRSIFKVMVITSIIFLISFLSEIHFCRAKREWCEGGFISEGRSDFGRGIMTFRTSNYGWGAFETNTHSEFPCCFQLVLLVSFKSCPGFFHCYWKSFPYCCWPSWRWLYF